MKTLLTRLILRFWPLVLVVTLAVAALSVPRTIALFTRLSTDTADLLARDHPNVQTLFQVRRKMEKTAKVSIVFESEDPATTIRFLEDSAARLKTHPLVGDVQTQKAGYAFFDTHKLLYAELEDLITVRDRLERRIEQGKLGGLYVDLSDETDEADSAKEPLSFEDLKSKYTSQSGADAAASPYFVSKDGKIFSISVEMKGDTNDLDRANDFQDAIGRFVTQLEPLAYHPTMTVYFSGASKVIEYHSLIADLKRIGLISGILLFIPLLIRFRNLLHVGIIFLPIAVGLPISFGLASLVIEKLTISTSFLFAVFGGLGIESGIHIFARYHDAKLAGQSLPDILDEIYGHLGRSILTAVTSVAMTFLLLMLLDFRGFSEFGLLSGLGLWVLFLVYFSFFPALLILCEKAKLLHFKPWKRWGSLQLALRQGHFTLLLIFFSAFSIYSVIATPRLQFEFDSKKIRADIPEVKLARAKQRETTSSASSPAMLLIQSEPEAEALKAAIAQKINSDDSATIDRANSYYDLVPKQQPEKMQVLQEIYRLLDDPTLKLMKDETEADIAKVKDTIAATQPFTEADLPPEAVTSLKGRIHIPGELFFIRALPKLELDDGRNAMAFADDVAHLQTPQGDYHPASDAIIYGLVLKAMFNDAYKVMLISFFSVALFVFLDFRNVRKTAIIMLSISVGVFWLFGMMALFNIKFNFYNMVIIPAIMGMSIDNSIHIFHRYEELGRGSVPKVLTSTGVAAMLASLTNASGFFGLLFCAHQGLYSIGVLAVLGVATCFVSTLVFLPVMLQVLERRGKYL